MRFIDSLDLSSLAKADPLVLAVLFLGLIGLGLIYVLVVLIRSRMGRVRR